MRASNAGAAAGVSRLADLYTLVRALGLVQSRCICDASHETGIHVQDQKTHSLTEFMETMMPSTITGETRLGPT